MRSRTKSVQRNGKRRLSRQPSGLFASLMHRASTLIVCQMACCNAGSVGLRRRLIMNSKLVQQTNR
ncbi:hypothetical protein ATCV1_z742R [Acanthocystis turfacea chlorella virus 1]|uniref:Uncharacterized protein z742R n=1 Tax=Chlorovirus heliozoae TaxID=322019 RepID=A7KA02_9PHYC|nr:hypothetical protein ATCV1_z742R [Acanthocystis turfacea chlorella virus 1]ABT16876.1 hypothetical protein ATCV1_z742R [Acanthocystis turfacea chlorella virus 1]